MTAACLHLHQRLDDNDRPIVRGRGESRQVYYARWCKDCGDVLPDVPMVVRTMWDGDEMQRFISRSEARGYVSRPEGWR